MVIKMEKETILEICDRCNCEFSMNFDDNSRNTVKLYHYGRTPKGNIEINIKERYLCPSCIEALEQWLNNKV